MLLAACIATITWTLWSSLWHVHQDDDAVAADMVGQILEVLDLEYQPGAVAVAALPTPGVHDLEQPQPEQTEEAQAPDDQQQQPQQQAPSAQGQQPDDAAEASGSQPAADGVACAARAMAACGAYVPDVELAVGSNGGAQGDEQMDLTHAADLHRYRQPAQDWTGAVKGHSAADEWPQTRAVVLANG